MQMSFSFFQSEDLLLIFPYGHKASLLLYHVPDGGHDPIPRRKHAAFQTTAALRRFLSGADFVVVQVIQLPYADRGKVGHHHIGARLQPELASLRMGGAERRRRRDQGIREHQPQEGNQPQGERDAAAFKGGKRRILMGDIGTDTDHVGA